jgi:hypothetical protein
MEAESSPASGAESVAAETRPVSASRAHPPIARTGAEFAEPVSRVSALAATVAVAATVETVVESRDGRSVPGFASL